MFVCVTIKRHETAVYVLLVLYSTDCRDVTPVHFRPCRWGIPLQEGGNTTIPNISPLIDENAYIAETLNAKCRHSNSQPLVQINIVSVFKQKTRFTKQSIKVFKHFTSFLFVCLFVFLEPVHQQHKQISPRHSSYSNQDKQTTKVQFHLKIQSIQRSNQPATGRPVSHHRWWRSRRQ